MIKAIFQADEDLYRSLDVSGHAEYGAYGKDLICASVSSIMFGFMNALDALEEECRDQTVRKQDHRSQSQQFANSSELFRTGINAIKNY